MVTNDQSGGPSSVRAALFRFGGMLSVAGAGRSSQKGAVCGSRWARKPSRRGAVPRSAPAGAAAAGSRPSLLPPPHTRNPGPWGPPTPTRGRATGRGLMSKAKTNEHYVRDTPWTGPGPRSTRKSDNSNCQKTARASCPTLRGGLALAPERLLRRLGPKPPRSTLSHPERRTGRSTLTLG